MKKGSFFKHETARRGRSTKGMAITMENMKELPIKNTAVGIDIGSTTAKLVIVEDGQVLYAKYERHYSQVRQKTVAMLADAAHLLKGKTVSVAIAGSAGLGTALSADLPFVQEVFATAETVRTLAPETDAVIELGGEDAKIIFFDGGLDERMNGSCAGGTGAFIDQMATLLDVTNDEMDELSLTYSRIYPIASRCGVFAKTDIQPLLNQGARKEDIAASIYQAVVNQTIAGLAQGRKIGGNVMFLGGPLYYCKGLRARFMKTLKLDEEHAAFPPYALYAVSLGAALYGDKQKKPLAFEELFQRLQNSVGEKEELSTTPPLFANEEEYEVFSARHGKATAEFGVLEDYRGKAYLGIDCGSTTTKLVLISEDNKILYTYYDSNKGNPVQIVKEQLGIIYSRMHEDAKICGSGVTGYGEELICHAFHTDAGLVETMAHYSAAKYFNPKVDFILDIGGQDIKCFKVHNDSIDSIILNEACSSGCGSFIETFARSMGYSVEEFAKKGLFGNAPVDLGTRCTVFMNSSVKQAQKDGASVENISAGLSVSVVKNAIYKVIRAANADELGKEIVVQGGTFMNDAVLRSFEKEIGRNVIRPKIAPLMGAFGAALHAKSLNLETSSLLSKEEIQVFTHTAKGITCGGCGNRCHMTVNTFGTGEKYISGNQCEKGAGIRTEGEPLPNLYARKRELLVSRESKPGKKKLGLPLALGTFELLPLWHGIFTSLGYEVVVSEFSTRKTYMKGQYSIPSDTACYPAKIMHGHMEELIEKGCDILFYPALTYNMDEHNSDNHYNCPVVAYYAELLNGNMESVKDVKFFFPYLNVNDEKACAKELYAYLQKHAPEENHTKKDCKKAVAKGMADYRTHMAAVRAEGEKAVDFARKHGKKILILAGRPYHIDPEICHGIDKLAVSLGFVVVSEDSIAHLAKVPPVQVLNQWTYHSRLYAAAQFAAENKDVELVQMVSFGCGVDAITTDEVRAILEKQGKLYTQLKIDEITNLGAVRIRLRSLFAALEEKDAERKA